MAIFPDVPTTAEAGYPAVDGADWKALLGPAGLPDQVVRTLHAEMQAALAAPETVERLASEGAEPMASSPESTRAFILHEQKRWGEVVRHSGAKAD
jgi:tripartite-type tricarboxylate transporter receptor subunit TctC